MTDIFLQIFIFFILIGQGIIFRLSYSIIVLTQRRVNNIVYTVVTDIANAMLNVALMLLTCFVYAGEVRIFYALFFLAGALIAELLLKFLKPRILKFLSNNKLYNNFVARRKKSKLKRTAKKSARAEKAKTGLTPKAENA